MFYEHLFGFTYENRTSKSLEVAIITIIVNVMHYPYAMYLLIIEQIGNFYCYPVVASCELENMQ